MGYYLVKKKKQKTKQNKSTRLLRLIWALVAPMTFFHGRLNYILELLTFQLEAQVGQISLGWIRLIMTCYIVLWWPSWISDQIAFNNPESDVV